MIIEGIVSIFCNILIGIISGFSNVVSIPLSAIYEIAPYTKFFTYLVGNDIISAFVVTFTFWLVLHATVSIVLFIYRLIPFT